MKRLFLRTVFILPSLISLLLLCLLVFSSLKYLAYKERIWEKDTRGRILEVLVSKKASLEKALFSRVYYTKSIAAFVSLNPDISDQEFTNLAYELIKNDSVISTMALSKDCILGSIYPLEGHEAAIGLDLLQHPERRKIVKKTIETQNAFIAGPVELVEGGVAFISYTPIFNRTSGIKNDFWGVTDIVIYRDKLIGLAGLKAEDHEFQFALKGYDGSGDNGEVWWGNPQAFEKNPVKININLPSGLWVLGCTPIQGWNTYYLKDRILYIILFLSAFIISLLTWLLLMSYLKIRMKEQELRAIFNSLDSLIIEFDSEGRYIKIPPLDDKLLIHSRKNMIRKTVYDILDKDLADLHYRAINECLSTGKLVVIEYPLQINKEERWYTGRISVKSVNTVIFHAIDITVLKKNQVKLIQSEKELLELNRTKDKFFSIIAHDLKNPVGTLHRITELLYHNYENFESAKTAQWIKSIYENTENLHRLLENLLTWSQTQGNKISFHPEELILRNLVDEVLAISHATAFEKGISQKSNIPGNLKVNADKAMVETILRNLISNAIKYTHPKGEIKVYTSDSENDINKVTIVIEDNGIGIETKQIDQMFKIETNISTPGTQDEIGSGLGLILCKEFIEKHGEEIWVESKEGEGTKIMFTLQKL